MLNSTIIATRAFLKNDPSLTPADRTRILAAIRNHGKAEPEPTAPAATEPRLIRRAEAARRLGCGLRSIDKWSRDGILKKVTLPGRVHAYGFRESDVNALINNMIYS